MPKEKLTAYVIYGNLDGTTIGLMEAKNKVSIRLALEGGETLLLRFKATSWDEAIKVERHLAKTLDKIRRYTRKNR